MHTRPFPTILLGQLIERLDDISLRMQGVDHRTCKILSEIAESMEKQFPNREVPYPDHQTEITLTNNQWAFLDQMRGAA